MSDVSVNIRTAVFVNIYEQRIYNGLSSSSGSVRRGADVDEADVRPTASARQDTDLRVCACTYSCMSHHVHDGWQWNEPIRWDARGYFLENPSVFTAW
jgi:hypothetical protein